MSAQAPAGPGGHPLLVIIDPAARRIDGESVRIARDVLGAGAPVKVFLPDSEEEMARALARRGSRRPVVVGDDRALLRAVQLLHQERKLTECALSVVPVGGARSIAVAHSLGVPTSAVAAARAVLEGIEQRLDLLVDDGGKVVLGTLRITAGRGRTGAGGMDEETGYADAADESHSGGGGGAWWPPPLRACWSLVRTVGRPVQEWAWPRRPQEAEDEPEAETDPVPPLRVEADGVLLTDPDRPVEQVSVSAEGGLADIVVRPRESSDPVRAQARAVTVSGADFCYGAVGVAAEEGGPVRTRTWTVLPAALRLTVPAPRGGARAVSG